MSDNSLTPISSVMDRIRSRIEEQKKRCEEDPEYAAQLRREQLEMRRTWEKSQADERAVEKQRARIERRRIAQVPERLLPFLESHQSTEALECAIDFIEGPATLLVLSGGVGCGKTVAACVAMDSLPAQGFFVSAYDLVCAGPYAPPEFKELLKVQGVLVIDELGTEPLDEKGWGLSTLLAVFSARYDAMTKTIFTTNTAHAAFLMRYGRDGGRVRDRLREAGTFVELKGQSMRGPNAQKL